VPVREGAGRTSDGLFWPTLDHTPAAFPGPGPLKSALALGHSFLFILQHEDLATTRCPYQRPTKNRLIPATTPALTGLTLLTVVQCTRCGYRLSFAGGDLDVEPERTVAGGQNDHFLSVPRTGSPLVVSDRPHC
jgi:hypothetical protein